MRDAAPKRNSEPGAGEKAPNQTPSLVLEFSGRIENQSQGKVGATIAATFPSCTSEECYPLLQLKTKQWSEMGCGFKKHLSPDVDGDVHGKFSQKRKMLQVWSVFNIDVLNLFVARNPVYSLCQSEWGL